METGELRAPAQDAAGHLGRERSERPVRAYRAECPKRALRSSFIERTKSSEYEILAEWHAERAPLDEEHLLACQAMAVVGIVLRELAHAIDLERMGDP